MISPPALDGTVLAPLPPVRIEKFAIKSGLPTITFTALKAKSYSLQRTASVKTGPWVKVKDVAVQAVTSVIEVNDTTAAGKPIEFYRLVAN
jgi:hypothetical protein